MTAGQELSETELVDTGLAERISSSQRLLASKGIESPRGSHSNRSYSVMSCDSRRARRVHGTPQWVSTRPDLSILVGGLALALLLAACGGGPSDEKSSEKSASHIPAAAMARDTDVEVVATIDGQAIQSYDDLYTALDPHEPGDVVTVDVENGRKRRELKIELQEIQ
jgi:hypothetical protein